MRLTIYLLFILIPALFYAQIEENVWRKSLTPVQLNADFDLLVSALADVHPAIYQYTTKEELAVIETAIRQQFTEPKSSMEFHILVRQYIEEIKCGHTMALPNQEWYESQAQNPSRIPLEIYLINNTIYVKHIYQEGKINLIGAEILSIDGRTAEQILKDMYAIQERDGLEEAFRNSKVERIFKTYHHFLYGAKLSHVMEYNYKGGLGTIELVSGSFDIMPAKEFQDSTLYDLQVKSSGASFYLYGESKIPVLDLNTFYRKDFKQFYKSMFKKLAQSKSENLVIDLRGNGGGFFPHGAMLLKYLMKEKFTFDFYRNPEKPKKNEYLIMPFPNKMTKLVFSTIPDSDKNDLNRNYQIRYKIKKKNHFDGKVIVLTDGATFSMGSLVAAKLKYNRDATIIGIETGGTEEGSNAVLTGQLSLPNSGIRVVVPNYHFNHKVNGQNNGRGLLPDVRVDYSVSERMADIDKEMMEIQKIILSNGKN